RTVVRDELALRRTPDGAVHLLEDLAGVAHPHPRLLRIGTARPLEHRAGLREGLLDQRGDRVAAPQGVEAVVTEAGDAVEAVDPRVAAAGLVIAGVGRAGVAVVAVHVLHPHARRRRAPADVPGGAGVAVVARGMVGIGDDRARPRRRVAGGSG